MHTYKKVWETGKAIVEANPDAVNPRLPQHEHQKERGHAPGCAYNKVDDGYNNGPNTAEHCIAGAILVELGIDLPPEGVRINSYREREYFDYTTAKRLSELQREADEEGVTWGEAWARTMANHSPST